MESFDDHRASTLRAGARRLALAAATTAIVAAGMPAPAAVAAAPGRMSCDGYPSARTAIPVRFKSHRGDMDVTATTCVVGKRRAAQKARVVVSWRPASTARGRVARSSPRQLVWLMTSSTLESGSGGPDGRIGGPGGPSSLAHEFCFPPGPEPTGDLMVGSEINVRPAGLYSCDTRAGSFVSSPKQVSADGEIHYAFTRSQRVQEPSWQLKGSPVIPSVS